MLYYTMRARTVKGAWHSFDIADIPTYTDSSTIALLAKRGSPLLKGDTICRGDRATNLYEGDVVLADGKRWLVCYERGFYLISSDYAIMYFDDLSKYSDFKVVGDYWQAGFPLSLNVRQKHMFKYKGHVFKLNDIIGASNDRQLFIRGISKAISPEDIQQECGMRVNGTRIYLGDKVPDGTVGLSKGRVVNIDTGVDLTVGGIVTC